MAIKSKWANDEDDAAEAARRKHQKDEKKRAKAARLQQTDQDKLTPQNDTVENPSDRPSKRRRLSEDDDIQGETPLLRFQAPGWSPSRTISDFDILNPIEEGTYGYVSRARSKSTGELVALKKMKMDQATASYGIPVTALREIQTLQRARHRNIINLQEVIVGAEDAQAQRLQDIYLVMDFAAHDLRSLLEEMAEPFLPSEVKTLMVQLTSALSFLHSRWILHRDLKTSNILLTSAACVKLADFGMARFTSSPPPPNLTSLVVTLWYRAPELLLGASVYDFAIDMWSLGCVFGELVWKQALLPGKNEVDQLAKIFDLAGLPTEDSWPGFRRLSNAKTLRLPSTQNLDSTKYAGRLRNTFMQLPPAALNLLESLLSLDPAARPGAEDVLHHHYFSEDPRPKSEGLFPTFPSKAGLEKRRKKQTPDAPARGHAAPQALDLSGLFK